MNIVEWIKQNATLKEGVDIKEAEKLMADLDPLKNITSKEAALEFIDRNGFFKSALDSAISKAVASHDEKFKAEKLPEILKAETEKIRAELNPEETPEQKRLRELEAKLQQAEKERQINELKSQLRAQAKEMGFTMDAERYAAYGDKAFDMMKADKEAIDALIEETKKSFYDGNPKPTKPELDPDKAMTRAEYDALSPLEQQKFIVESKGVVIEE